MDILVVNKQVQKCIENIIAQMKTAENIRDTLEADKQMESVCR